MKTVPILSALVLSAPLLAAGHDGAGSAPAGGTVSGKVVFSGDKLPEPAKLDMASKPDHAERCMQSPIKTSEELLIDPASKGIANVYVEVRVKAAEPWKPEGSFGPSDQEFCRFLPHVMVVPVGKAIAFKNTDPFLHNVHFYCKKNTAENFGIPENGTKEITFKSDEKVIVKCDVHTWMSAVIIATDNPYHALTAADGSFQVENVPPGKYEVRFWHEKLGEWRAKDIEIKDGANTLDAKSADFKP
ncbi:MAG: hypothetical protein EYC70_05745 [Planctomycetota bacterium]|nr:MAG: hypothetical protein EYC70_05745 [Planctomycetota bacterium]